MTNLICRLIGMLLLATTFLFPNVALALDYPPPLSFSNAELQRHDFIGWEVRAAEFSNANLSFADFSYADARGAIFSVSVAQQTYFHGTDFSTGLLDMVNFIGLI